ncbi:MAG: methyltransferase family protein [Methylocystis sp.]
MSDKPDVRILPPILLGAALAAGYVASRYAPAPIVDARVATGAGAVAILGSLALLGSAVHELRRAETTFDVRKSSTAIVNRGAFAISRNPVYLSMTLLCAGSALLLNSFWALLLTWPLGSALCLIAIKPEEAYLAAKFGESYASYRAKVRRWI